MPPERRIGPSYMRGGVVACPKRRHASPVRGLPHGRRRRRHLEGGNCPSVLHGVDVAVVLARMLLRVSLWADLTQPGGELHWSKPVREKSKG